MIRSPFINELDSHSITWWRDELIHLGYLRDHIDEYGGIDLLDQDIAKLTVYLRGKNAPV